MSAFDVRADALPAGGDDVFDVEAKQPWAVAVLAEEREAAKKEISVAWSQSQTAFQQLALAEPGKSGETKTGGRTLRARNFIVPSPNAPHSRLSGKHGAVDLTFVGRFPSYGKPLVVTLSHDMSWPAAAPVLISKATLTSFDCGDLPEPVMARVSLCCGGVTLNQTAEPDDVCTDESDSKRKTKTTGVLVNLRKSVPRVLSAVQAGESTDGSDAPHAAWVARLASLNETELIDRIEADTFVYTPADGAVRTEFVRVRLPKEAGAAPTSAMQFLVMTDWHNLASKTVVALNAISDEKQKDAIRQEFAVDSSTEQQQPAHVLVYKPALFATVQRALRRAGRHHAVVDMRDGFTLCVTPVTPGKGPSVFTGTVRLEYSLFAHPDNIQVYKAPRDSNSTVTVAATAAAVVVVAGLGLGAEASAGSSGLGRLAEFNFGDRERRNKSRFTSKQ